MYYIIYIKEIEFLDVVYIRGPDLGNSRKCMQGHR